MTLTYKLDLDILPLDLHAKIQVSMYIRLYVRVVTQTHRQCQNYYTRHVTDVGCNNPCMYVCIFVSKQLHHFYMDLNEIAQLKRDPTFIRTELTVAGPKIPVDQKARQDHQLETH